MAARTNTALGKAYEGLQGAALIDELARHGETRILETLWRCQNAEVAADAAPAMIATGDQHLLTLLVDEILAPRFADTTVSQQIAKAVAEHQPRIAAADTQRLGDRLLDPAPLPANYQSVRATLLGWVIAQPSHLGFDLALRVITRGAPASDQPEARQAAYAACRADRKLLDAAAEAVSSELDETPHHQGWLQAVEFLEGACPDEQTTPESARPLVRRLVEIAAPQHQPVVFPETLRRLALDSALDTIQTLLGESLTSYPGACEIVRLLPEVTPATRRAQLWAVAVRHQNQLWAPDLQGQTGAWDEAEWRRVLRELAKPEQVYREALTHIVSSAPLNLAGELVRLVIAQVPANDHLISVIGQRVSERLAALGDASETHEAWVGAVHWPPKGNEDEVEKLGAILAKVDPDQRVRLLIRGYESGKLSDKVIAGLIPSALVSRSLEIVDRTQRSKWATTLAEVHPDELAAGAAPFTGAGDEFDVDLVAALAPERPDLAFAHVGGAWNRLTVEEKEELVTLLEKHGTSRSLDALETVIRDDHRENAKRRVRATRRLGELLEPGSEVPEIVEGLLNSNKGDLRAAAVEVIKRAQPRDPGLIGRLHKVAADRGAAARAAEDALDALARRFLDEFTSTSDKDELRSLMPLLGAVARPSVLQPLFEYLGADAVYDDQALKGDAAEAVRAAIDQINEVGAEDQEALVLLIDGEEQESSPPARAALSAALARVQLGEDVGLKLLYDEIGLTPQGSPARLYGAEREPLVRQLALLDRAKARGEEGWGAELAHRDLVAERLVRAAYLVSDGGPETIAEQIRNDTRIDWGNVIKALANVKQLHNVQGLCQVLHGARGDHSEIAHVGKQPEEGTMAAAREAYREIAERCVRLLDHAKAASS